MTRHYSALSLIKEGLANQKGWQPAWRSPEPKSRYDAIIIGGGGHGLATAYYLAKYHNVTNVAVIEKGWLGGGNTGRNTTTIRSNYFYPESSDLYDYSMKLYEGLSKELNYNIMFSQHGVLTMVHSKGEMEIAARLVNAMQINGTDADLLSLAEVKEKVPLYDFSPSARYPVWGGVWQGRAGSARHDAVAWGYARGADRLGVDIIQNCEVTDFIIEGGRCRGVKTSKGEIRSDNVGLAVAGHTSQVCKLAGFDVPIISYTLQACVSEPVKPALGCTVLAPATGTYVNQSAKGEFVIGGGIDRTPSYAQRGNLPQLETVLSGLLEMFPAIGQLKLMRQWGGVCDVTPDSSPIFGESPLPGLYLSCGWGTGGFKAIPAGGVMLAHLLATGKHHDLSKAFGLDRFRTGRLIDEAAGSGIPH
ncbi:sarcosine oxidase subunit beta family protein [Rhizobium sp.]